ncbi:MAG: hypothetical protein L6R40_000259 [Gallowayella cf. fulva]|nr:MAG: hypothetical protein L6R40_000259 [Xanthomendoza cf. fulva]
MAFKIYTTDKTSERCFPWLWFVRLLQILVTIIILAITASNASDFTSIGCSVPSKLGYNIAAAVLSFIVLLLLILSTGRTTFFRVVPWIVWGQLALDVFMFIIWIAASAVSQYNCTDLCNSCAGYDHVWTSGLDCLCSSYYLYYDKRDQSPAPRGLAAPIQERASYRHNSGPSSSKKMAKAALDAIMVVLFAFTTAATIFWIFKNRKAAAAAGTSAAPTDSTAPQQSGALPATPAPGHMPENQPEASYSQPAMQETSSPLQQPQPQMQQQYEYPQPVQQYPYPVSGSQGAAGEYYNQPQSQMQQTDYAPNRAEMPSPPPQQHNVSPIDPSR